MEKEKSNTPNIPSVTVTYDLVKPYGDYDINFLMYAISTNQYKDKVLKIRALKSEGRIEEANRLKKTLPAATFSCCYEQHRCEENVTGYSQFVLLDADHLSPSTLVRVVAMLPCCRFTHGFFISPSGDGIKILVKTNGMKENHRLTYKAVMDYYASLLGIPFDSHCSDLCRLTFLSWDPQTYLNLQAEVFDVSKLVEVERPKRKRMAIPCYIDGVRYNMFSECVQSVNRYIKFEEGNRNNYCYRLARRCRLRGISEAEALEKILNHFDYDQQEIVATVRSAFRR